MVPVGLRTEPLKHLPGGGWRAVISPTRVFQGIWAPRLRCWLPRVAAKPPPQVPEQSAPLKDNCSPPARCYFLKLCLMKAKLEEINIQLFSQGGFLCAGRGTRTCPNTQHMKAAPARGRIGLQRHRALPGGALHLPGVGWGWEWRKDRGSGPGEAAFPPPSPCVRVCGLSTQGDKRQ